MPGSPVTCLPSCLQLTAVCRRPPLPPSVPARLSACQGNYSNDLAILDTGNLRWTYPEISGTLPPPRADCAMEFDAKVSRLCEQVT